VEYVVHLRNEKCIQSSAGKPEQNRPLVSMDMIGKGKVKMSLCLTKHHVMKAYWGAKA
jgi:hypothetical protein